MSSRSIAETSQLIRRGEVSPIEITRECLKTIERLDPALNAFITVTAQSAFAEAKEAEKEIQAGRWRGPLHGIPIGLKDLIDTAGVRTTAASAVYKERIPTKDADVVEKLRAAGAILIGKQNLHEFAYGGSSLISHFGPVRNPVDQDFVAGGSSGGSAAAVASGMCYAAVGTDTAGSIREPAALCGLVGLKPTYDLVSTSGIIPLSQSLDHVGPITRCVEDSAVVLNCIADTKANYRDSLRRDISEFVIGVPRRFFFYDLDADVARSVEQAIDEFRRIRATVRDTELPVSTDRTLQAYESYAYHRDKVAASPELYQAETLRRIKSGERITEAQYQAALRELQKTRAEIANKFREMDVLVTPTTPAPAPRISDLSSDQALLRPTELLLLRNTRPVNVWGLPAISVPCGFTSAGLPIGLQIIGPHLGEVKVLQAAYAYEQQAAKVKSV
jgi:aspartyl-tRNA(Asn)/glutamyl-tRNA(Gln) amidotransferase subunit A